MAVRKVIEVIAEYDDLAKVEQLAGDAGIQFDVLEVKAKGAKNEIEDLAESGGRDLSFLDEVTGGLGSKLDEATEGAKRLGLGIKGAVSATVIGALVVVLGEVIANWDKIVEFIDIANRKLQEQLTLTEQINDVLRAELALNESKEKLFEAEELSTQRVLVERIKILESIKSNNEAQLGLLQTQLESLRTSALEATIWERLLAFRLGVRAKGFINAKEREEINDLEVRILELQKTINDTDAALIKLTNPTSEDGDGGNNRSPESQGESVSGVPISGVEQLQQIGEARLEQLDVQLGSEADLVAAGEALKTRIEEENAQSRIRIAELEFQNKQELLFATGDALQALGSIVGEQTGAGKVLAIAGSLINTYAAIAGQLKAFSGIPIPGYAIAQAIATGLVGFKAVADIIKVKVPNSGGAGSVSSGIGSIPSSPAIQAAPSFNIIGQNPVNQLAESLATQENAPIEAFVTEKAVTSSQEAKRNKVETASL